MSADLDLVGPLPDIIASLTGIAEQIAANRNFNVALSYERKAQAIRDHLKAEAAAKDARVAATRLQMIALRQVALLGGVDQLPERRREAAEGFASYTDEEFARVLDAVTSLGEPVTIWRSLVRDRTEKNAQHDAGSKYGDLFTRFHSQPHLPTEDEEVSVRAAMRTLLSGPPLTDEAFTVADVARMAADKLEAETGSTTWQQGEVQELLIDAARRNIIAGGADADGIPEFLTVHDKELGWVRIPRSIALLAHLKAHAALRRQQLMQLENRVKELDKAVASFDRLLYFGEDDRTSLDALLERKTNERSKKAA